MTIRAVYSDLGGVLVRTEFQTPRQRLAERIGIEYEDLVKDVFEGKTSHQATLGVLSEDEHWKEVLRKFRLPAAQLDDVRNEFFAGDITDLTLVNYLRGLRKTVKVGLISNAWTGLREWIVKEKFDDAFDAMIISAEVGLAKPDPRIYQVALEKLGVAPSEAVLMDDFPENIEAARAFGMTAIHFTQPEKALDELKRLLANHR